MSIERVLVVYKKSLYELFREDQALSELESSTESRPDIARMLKSHDIQSASMAAVERQLSRRSFVYDIRWRGGVDSVKGYDLVIAVGGDGTVLSAAQWIRDSTPLLGINSNPTSSVGELCAGNANELDILLDQIEGSATRPTVLTRIRVSVDGDAVLGPCLNDVLFAHAGPADMSRFRLTTSARQVDPVSAQDGQWTRIRSSGIWVSSATGSTAAIRSAGGQVMPRRSKRIQYLVREPYSAPHEPPLIPLHGHLKPNETLCIRSEMRSAHVWGDGPLYKAPIAYGQLIVFDHHPASLRLFLRDYKGTNATRSVHGERDLAL